MRKLRIFLALGSRERRAFLRAWTGLCLAKLGLAVMGLPRALRLMARPAKPDRGVCDSRLEVKWNAIAARYVPGGASCLVRSVALLGVLRRRGIAAELRIGVGAASPALEAHAWVEVGGVPINDSDDVTTRYRPFSAPSPAS